MKTDGFAPGALVSFVPGTPIWTTPACNVPTHLSVPEGAAVLVIATVGRNGYRPPALVMIAGHDRPTGWVLNDRTDVIAGAP